MPLNLLLTRHGQSEGNVILKDRDLFTAEFLARHSSNWRLTGLGVQQARAAGAVIVEIADQLLTHGGWPEPLLDSYLAFLRGEAPRPDHTQFGLEAGPRLFDRYYTSPFLRAMETAANMGLPDANWYINTALHERNYGDFDRLHKSDYGDSLDVKRTVPFYWKPPNGESIADMCNGRLKGVLSTLARECEGQNVLMVCHGEVMEGFVALLERMPQSDYIAWLASDDPTTDTRNGQILHYSRVNPFTGEVEKHLNWKRALVPLEPERAYGWVQVKRPTFSNEQLLGLVADTAPLLP